MMVCIMPHPPLAIPAIGDGSERRIQATLDGYHRLSEHIAGLKPKTIIVVSPHGNAFRDAVSLIGSVKVEGDFAGFGHPSVGMRKNIDTKLTMDILSALQVEGISAVILDESTSTGYGVRLNLDHGAMVPLYFVDEHYQDYKLVHITSSFASPKVHYEMGSVIRKAADESSGDVVLLISGDLSHALKEEGPYNYHPYGEVFDHMVYEAIEEKCVEPLLHMTEKEMEDAAQCGLRSICLGFGYAGNDWTGHVYSYEGPFGVGYLTAILE